MKAALAFVIFSDGDAHRHPGPGNTHPEAGGGPPPKVGRSIPNIRRRRFRTTICVRLLVGASFQSRAKGGARGGFRTIAVSWIGMTVDVRSVSRETGFESLKLNERGRTDVYRRDTGRNITEDFRLAGAEGH